MKAATPRRAHLTRLMSIWRSAGWPSHDAIEIDLLAAEWVTLTTSDTGHQTLRLTEAGIKLLAAARQSNQRSLSAHDRLAERLAMQLIDGGRVVWRELSLRAAVTTGETTWRIARPDVFSVRNTSVEDYLQPTVHEVKVSRADLLSDLRHAAKRESYQWLSCETYYVLPVGIAEPHEIPEVFGVWMLDGSIEDGRLELVRPAHHTPCKLPFAVWLALAKATPVQSDRDPGQRHLGEPDDGAPILTMPNE